MLELGSILRTTYGAYVIGGAYNGVADSTEVPDDDTAVATIQYLLRGQIDGSRHNAGYANEAVSMAQTFAEAATGIDEKLGRMEQLAEEAATGQYSQEQLAEMQQELEQLAEEINDIVENTEYNGNKLFSAEGETISISIGYGSTIDIIAKDLSFDIEGLDLTTDAEGALAAIQSKVSQSDYYSEYINKQADRLESAIDLIEYEINNALGFEPDDFDTNIVERVASYAASQVLEDISVLLDTQANITPDRALQVLKDSIEELTEQDSGEDA